MKEEDSKRRYAICFGGRKSPVEPRRSLPREIRVLCFRTRATALPPPRLSPLFSVLIRACAAPVCAEASRTGSRGSSLIMLRDEKSLLLSGHSGPPHLAPRATLKAGNLYLLTNKCFPTSKVGPVLRGFSSFPSSFSENLFQAAFLWASALSARPFHDGHAAFAEHSASEIYSYSGYNLRTMRRLFPRDSVARVVTISTYSGELALCPGI